jgi:hypothetical protein
MWKLRLLLSERVAEAQWVDVVGIGQDLGLEMVFDGMVMVIEEYWWPC